MTVIVAHLAEHLVVIQKVVGSIPANHPNIFGHCSRVGTGGVCKTLGVHSTTQFDFDSGLKFLPCGVTGSTKVSGTFRPDSNSGRASSNLYPCSSVDRA